MSLNDNIIAYATLEFNWKSRPIIFFSLFSTNRKSQHIVSTYMHIYKFIFYSYDAKQLVVSKAYSHFNNTINAYFTM